MSKREVKQLDQQTPLYRRVTRSGIPFTDDSMDGQQNPDITVRDNRRRDEQANDPHYRQQQQGEPNNKSPIHNHNQGSQPLYEKEANARNEWNKDPLDLQREPAAMTRAQLNKLKDVLRDALRDAMLMVRDTPQSNPPVQQPLPPLVHMNAPAKNNARIQMVQPPEPPPTRDPSMAAFIQTFADAMKNIRITAVNTRCHSPNSTRRSIPLNHFSRMWKDSSRVKDNRVNNGYFL